MKRIVLSLMVSLAILAALGQEPPATEPHQVRSEAREAQKSIDRSPSTAKTDGRRKPAEDLADEFVPSEEISADHAVSFPADI
jgi:hypothetical protein